MGFGWADAIFYVCHHMKSEMGSSMVPSILVGARFTLEEKRAMGTRMDFSAALF